MLNDADKWTDKELERLEKRIAKEYKQASEELQEKATEYFEKYQERWDKEYIAYQKGKYTDEQWKQWQIAQLGRGDRWNELKDQMTQRLAESAQIAQGYINHKLPSIYASNSNGEAKIATQSAIAQGVTGVKFDLVDEYTVRRLMMGSSEVRPYKPIEIDLPKTNRFNYTKLQNALLQGILQGDSISEIADRFQAVSDMNRSSAIRNARTAVTGAQNAGKQDRFKEASKKGCDVIKRWKATGDARTRAEHMQAWSDYGDWDTAIPYDEPFEVGGEELMYPADTSLGASGWNVYNCRCTMSSKYKFKSILSPEMQQRANIRLKTEKPYFEQITQPQTQNLLNRNEQEVIFHVSDNMSENAEQNIEIIKDLLSEYDSYLSEWKIGGAQNGAGEAGMDGTVRINNNKTTTWVHEFAHTLATQERVKVGLADENEKAFEKELAKLFTEYKKAVNGNYNLSMGSYSLKNKDEFMAEAFTMAKSQEYGYELEAKYGKDFTYANKLMILVDKYFKKGR